jgi:hypothetical protein
MRIMSKGRFAAVMIPLALAAATAGSAAAAPSTNVSGSTVSGSTVSGSTVHRASAAAGTTRNVVFLFSISGLPAGDPVMVNYSSNETGVEGFAQASSGSMSAAFFLSGFMEVVASSSGSLNVNATVTLATGSATVTGTALIPVGTTVTMTNDLTKQEITLTGGSFSIPSGVGVGVSIPSGVGVGGGVGVTG